MVADSTGTVVSCTIEQRKINLSQNERVASAVAGGALLLFGLNRLSIPAMILTTVGGALLYRGTTGYCPFVADELADDTGRIGNSERRSPAARGERSRENARTGR